MSGVTYYISLWYPRRLQAKRVALFFSSGSLAGAFGGILAFGIEHLDGRGGLHGWQWIVSVDFSEPHNKPDMIYQFLLEGLMTVILATLSFFFMHDVSLLLTSFHFCTNSSTLIVSSNSLVPNRRGACFRRWHPEG